MLPLPNLDDREFDKILSESRKLIPKIFPEWTDENVHDPGITFIELLAWLTEMQQYHLNQVTDAHERKFLKLLGYKLRATRPALGYVTFGNVQHEIVIPKGTKLHAHQLPFETALPVKLLSSRMEKIMSSSALETNDFTASNDNIGVSFPAFGSEGHMGSKLYIGFDQPLPIASELVIHLQLFDQYPIQKGLFSSVEERELFVPSGKVEWHVYGGLNDEQGSASWVPLFIKQDETNHLTHSGRLVFEVSEQMAPFILHPANDKSRFWMSCTVVEEGFEIAPRIEKVSLNSVPVVQWETKSMFKSFDSDGNMHQQMVVGEYLFLHGKVSVQVLDDDGNWVTWQAVDSLTDRGPNDQVYQIDVHHLTQMKTIQFGDGQHGFIPEQGQQNIRIIAYQPEFEKERMIGSSSGLPNQVFDLRLPVLSDQFILQIGTKDKANDQWLWKDWVMVDHFDLSSSSDRHFIFDRNEGKIMFGNNERGWIPPKEDEINIFILSCRVGGGERGNVNHHTINQFAENIPEHEDLQVINHFPANGGQESETLLDAKGRVQRQLLQSDRAVTAEDFERIALHTPGLRMARVKAIPAFMRGLRNYPTKKAPAKVTVVVVPYSLNQKPMPSVGFLKTAQRHLDRYRLLTNDVRVIPPEYVKVTVYAVIVIEPGVEDIEQLIKHELGQYLKPLDGGDGSAGWPFGKSVFKGDIYGVINQIKGVAYVQDLWLNAEGIGAVKEAGGNISIPPHGLVFSGEHEIELMNRTDL